MAKKHIVKCAICGQQFDLNAVQGVKHGARRYAHQTCYPEGEIVPLPEFTKEEQDYQSLKDYINELYGTSANWVMITKQIKQYTSEENKYTYSGIKKSLEYFYKVKGNSVKDARGGIGIVPYVYKDAYNYYYALWEAKQRNEDKDITAYIPKIKEVEIPVPQRKIKKRKLFSFLDEEN